MVAIAMSATMAIAMAVAMKDVVVIVLVVILWQASLSLLLYCISNMTKVAPELAPEHSIE